MEKKINLLIFSFLFIFCCVQTIWAENEKKDKVQKLFEESAVSIPQEKEKKDEWGNIYTYNPEIEGYVPKDNKWKDKDGSIWTFFLDDNKNAIYINNSNKKVFLGIKNGTKEITIMDYKIDEIINKYYKELINKYELRVFIPNSVTKIGYYAFSYYPLTSVNIPNTVKEIGEGAFSNCKSLKWLYIPNSVTKIGRNAFTECSSLEKINIPNSVKYLGFYAFSKCKSLKSITIPESVTSYSYNAFEDCTSLTTVNIGTYVISPYMFNNCTSLKKVNISPNTKMIYHDAFYNCYSLTNINIPNSVKHIGTDAFYNVPHITYHGKVSPNPPDDNDDWSLKGYDPKTGRSRIGGEWSTGLDKWGAKSRN